MAASSPMFSATASLKRNEIEKYNTEKSTDDSAISLDPDESVVIVRDLDAFQFRYPGVDNVAGEYSQRLDNGGEQITLIGPAGEVIHNFVYGD